MNKFPNLQLLLLISAVAVLLSLALDKEGGAAWASAALLNAGTGVLTSIVIIYAYDKLISKKLESERALRELRALSAAGPSLRQHYRVLLDCYRSSCNSSQAPRFKDINEFLGPQYQPVFANLNLYAPSPSDSVGSKPYYLYIHESFLRLHQELSTLLALSGHDLSQEVALSVRRVLDSEFMLVARSLNELFNSSATGIGPLPSQLITGMKPHIEGYCAAFAHLVSAFEKVHTQGLREYRESEWHNATFLPGHARNA